MPEILEEPIVTRSGSVARMVRDDGGMKIEIFDKASMSWVDNDGSVVPVDFFPGADSWFAASSPERLERLGLSLSDIR